MGGLQKKGGVFEGDMHNMIVLVSPLLTLNSFYQLGGIEKSAGLSSSVRVNSRFKTSGKEQKTISSMNWISAKRTQRIN